MPTISRSAQSAFEFVLDFGQSYTASQPAQLHTRVVINPFYAKILFNLLQDSINQHELNFGVILDHETKNLNSLYNKLS